MTDVPDHLSYTREHEWMSQDDPAMVGITAHAVSELGDIVFIELPDVGHEYAAGDQCGEIESTKAVSELYAPVGGKIVEVNERIVDAPEEIAADPYGEGWLFKIEVSDAEYVLLDAKGYRDLISD